MRTPLVVMVAATASLACAGGMSAPKDTQVGEPFALAVGESAEVKPTSIVVRFVSVSDSRCPSDVTCVQAGDAAVALALSGAGAARTDTLYLVRAPRAADYGRYRFELMDVQPYPRTNAPVGSRTATIRARRLP